MSKYLTNIINRHAANVTTVRPRERSRYETVGDISATTYQEKQRIESTADDKPSNIQVPLDHSKRSTKPSIDKPEKTTSTKVENIVKKELLTLPKTDIETAAFSSVAQKETNEELVRKEKINARVKQKKVQKKIDTVKAEISKGRHTPAVGPFELQFDASTMVDQIEESKKVNLKDKQLNSVNEVASIFSPMLKEEINQKAIQDEQSQISSNQASQEIKQKLMAKLQMDQSENYLASVDHSTQEVQSSTIPTVKIQIGRIDIKAVKQKENLGKRNPKTNHRNSGMSLDQFLQKRAKK